jgi:hypothetical protein
VEPAFFLHPHFKKENYGAMVRIIVFKPTGLISFSKIFILLGIRIIENKYSSLEQLLQASFPQKSRACNFLGEKRI